MLLLFRNSFCCLSFVNINSVCVSSFISKFDIGKKYYHSINNDSSEEGVRKSSHGWTRKWLVRQAKDPYVKQRQFDDYRARSAYKLLEIDDEFKILKPGMNCIELGAAPGSWTQVLVRRTKIQPKIHGKIIAVDKELMAPVEGAIVLDSCDFMEEENRQKILELCGGENTVDAVLSDMAPSRSGTHQLDHDRIIKLAYGALAFAVKCLKEDDYRSFFLCKLFQGTDNEKFFVDTKKFFKKTTYCKPDASRDSSSEMYVLGRHFKGINKK